MLDVVSALPDCNTISRERMMGNINTVFFAGYHTTRKTMIQVLYYLAQHGSFAGNVAGRSGSH